MSVEAFAYSKFASARGPGIQAYAVQSRADSGFSQLGRAAGFIHASWRDAASGARRPAHPASRKSRQRAVLCRRQQPTQLSQLVTAGGGSGASLEGQPVSPAAGHHRLSPRAWRRIERRRLRGFPAPSGSWVVAGWQRASCAPGIGMSSCGRGWSTPRPLTPERGAYAPAKWRRLRCPALLVLNATSAGPS